MAKKSWALQSCLWFSCKMTGRFSECRRPEEILNRVLRAFPCGAAKKGARCQDPGSQLSSCVSPPYHRDQGISTVSWEGGLHGTTCPERWSWLWLQVAFGSRFRRVLAAWLCTKELPAHRKRYLLLILWAALHWLSLSASRREKAFLCNAVLRSLQLDCDR